MAEYIDQQAFLKKLDIFSCYTKNNIAEILKAIPAADVATVVHGRWEDVSVHTPWIGLSCSACKRYSAEYTPYCPSCGAKMDKEESQCLTTL